LFAAINQDARFDGGKVAKVLQCRECAGLIHALCGSGDGLNQRRGADRFFVGAGAGSGSGAGPAGAGSWPPGSGVAGAGDADVAFAGGMLAALEK
jgi:hypothetical protein